MLLVQGEWLTRKEAMRYAGVFYTTLQEWEEKGYIETKKAGDKPNSPILIEKSSLDRHLATRQTPGRLSESETRERLAAAEAQLHETRTALAKSETERREIQERLEKQEERLLKLMEQALRRAAAEEEE